MQRIPSSSSDTVKLEGFALSLFKDYLCLPEITSAPPTLARAYQSVFDTVE